MTVQEMIDEAKWIKDDIGRLEGKLKKSKNRQIRSELRRKLREERYQLTHLECTLEMIKCDPLF